MELLTKMMSGDEKGVWPCGGEYLALGCLREKLDVVIKIRGECEWVDIADYGKLQLQFGEENERLILN